MIKFQDVIDNVSIKLSKYEHIQNVIGEKISRNTFFLNAIPSLCLLFAELHQVYGNDKYESITHDYFSKTADYLNTHTVDSLSLLDGLCNIGLTTFCISDNKRHYNKFLDTINEVLIQQTDLAIDTWLKSDCLRITDYDMLYGACGIANYLMLFADDIKIRNTLYKLTSYLLKICGKKHFNNHFVHGWLITDKESQYPNINMGLSHGIPTILATLIRLYQLDIKLPTQIDSMREIINFLMEHKVFDGEGYNWPAEVIFENNEYVNGKHIRDAWCYGAPGVAYSLLLSGNFFNDEGLKRIAIDSMLNSSYKLKEIISPTFCHGYSGIAYICHKFHVLTNKEIFKLRAEELSNKIISYYDITNPLGFKNYENPYEEVLAIDEINILSGTCGILLTLMAINMGQHTPWSTMFLLNDNIL